MVKLKDERTMTDITLSIPCLPDLDLSANRRRSRAWQAQWQDTKKERLDAGLVLHAAKPQVNVAVDEVNRFWRVLKCNGPVSLHWTLYWPKGMRARDADGCADLLKPWQDAMIDLGWLKNDSPRYVRRVSYESVPRSPLGPSMMLRIAVHANHCSEAGMGR